jgi:hypothetical protein
MAFLHNIMQVFEKIDFNICCWEKRQFISPKIVANRRNLWSLHRSQGDYVGFCGKIADGIKKIAQDVNFFLC